MKYIASEIGFVTKMLSWAVILHVRRWQRYRADVALWISSIWLTILAQGIFIFSAYSASGGNFFGYSFDDVVVFFAITLLSTGLAQIVVHGFTLRLADAVWRGDFDFWVVQPVHLFLRVLLEDIGLVWFWPHVIIGGGLLVWILPLSHVWLALLVAVIAAIIEIGLIICVCVPAIQWGRWNPNEGLWEYLERSRSIPLGRTKNMLLIVLSAGVLQYSLALEVFTGRLHLALFFALAIVIVTIAWFCMRYFVRKYTSASS